MRIIHKRYLKQKLRGGSVNRKGNKFENHFACYMIMQITRNFPLQLHDFLISSQVSSFVDDFYINDIQGKTESFYQLKTSSGLSWGTKFKTLFFDFNKQRGILQYRKKRFRLYLVVGDRTVFNKMKSTIPPKLRKSTTVAFFPYYNSINAQLMNDAAFRDAVSHLCALSDHNKLEALATCILGAWMATDQDNIPIADILRTVRNMGYSYLRSTIPLHISSDTDKILRNIPAFNYIIKNGYFSWTYATADSGGIPYLIDSPEFRNIEAEIVKEMPKTFDDLEKIIS